MVRSQQAPCLMIIAYLLGRPVQLVKSLTHELEYGAVQQHPCKLLSATYAREVIQQKFQWFLTCKARPSRQCCLVSRPAVL